MPFLTLVHLLFLICILILHHTHINACVLIHILILTLARADFQIAYEMATDEADPRGYQFSPQVRTHAHSIFPKPYTRICLCPCCCYAHDIILPRGPLLASLHVLIVIVASLVLPPPEYPYLNCQC